VLEPHEEDADRERRGIWHPCGKSPQPPVVTAQRFDGATGDALREEERLDGLTQRVSIGFIGGFRVRRNG